MKRTERTAPESRIREIRLYGLMRGGGTTVFGLVPVNPYLRLLYHSRLNPLMRQDLGYVLALEE